MPKLYDGALKILKRAIFSRRSACGSGRFASETNHDWERGSLGILRREELVSEAMNGGPRVMLEIPSEGLPFDWDKEIHKSVYDRMRREGLDRAQAKLAAKNSIKMSHELYRFRAPGGLFARPL